MTDKHEWALARAKQAELLLHNDLLIEIFQQLDNDYIAAWRATPARDNDARERLWQATQIVGKVREHLHSILNGGKLAQRELDELGKL